jgi:phasin family protein
MFNVPEQLVAANKSNLEIAAGITAATLEAAERLFDLQLSAAKNSLAENTTNAKALISAKDAQEVMALQSAIAEPAFEKALGFSRRVYEVASEAQAEISKLFEERATEFTKAVASTLEKVVKSAPVGSDVAVAALKSAMAAANSAYGTMTKTAKQVAELTEAGVAAATSQEKIVSSLSFPLSRQSPRVQTGAFYLRNRFKFHAIATAASRDSATARRLASVRILPATQTADDLIGDSLQVRSLKARKMA